MGMYLSGLFRMVFWLFCSIRAISTREKALISPVLIYILWNKIRDFFCVVLKFFGGCIDYLLSCSLLFILSSVMLDRLFDRLFVWAVFLIFDQCKPLIIKIFFEVIHYYFSADKVHISLFFLFLLPNFQFWNSMF